jgi:hypothetical protein
MRHDIQTIKNLYAAAEGDGLDVGKFISFFSEDAYVRDIPTDMEFRGTDIAVNRLSNGTPYRLPRGTPASGCIGSARVGLELSI